MDQQSRIGNIVNNKLYPLLLFLISFVFVVLFSRSTSFLYVFEGGDPSVFKQMGMALLKGKTLFVDYFDNKGFLLYLIHAIGLALGGDFFILLMQAISLTITLIIWDKMLALTREAKGRVIGLVIVLFLLLCLYATGDQSQEWCLPFASYPLLIYYQSLFKKRNIKPWQFFLIGICSGIITFIVANGTIAILGFLIYLWFKYLRQKDFKSFFASVLWVGLGFFVIVVPILLYFYLKAGWHGINEMLYASFFSNLEYVGYKMNREAHIVLPFVFFLLALSTVFIINSRKEKDVLVPSIVSIILFCLTNGKLCNNYYLIALLPLCVVLVMTFDPMKQRKIKTIISCITLCVFSIYAGIHVYQLVNDAILGNEKERIIYDDFHHCFEQIPINERDSIFNYNLYAYGTSLMQHEGHIQCNRVLYTSLTFMLPTLWEEETSKPFVPPKWMLISFDKKYIEEDANYIVENYDLVCSFPYDRVYWKKPKIGEAFNVYLYRRKD